MIKTVDQTTVAEIFSINNDKIYRIPKYQREYTWGINDWDALFNDITDNDCGYFLGSCHLTRKEIENLRTKQKRLDIKMVCT